MDGADTTMAQVDQDSPLWKAWLAYSETDSFRNTRRWALDPNHVQGSLWAAFHRGWIEGVKARGR